MSLIALRPEIETRIEQIDRNRDALLAHADPGRDWSELPVPKLKQELKKRKLPQTGVKKELVARLEQADATYDGSGLADWLRELAADTAELVARTYASVDAPGLETPQVLVQAMMNYRNNLAELIREPHHTVPASDVGELAAAAVQVAVQAVADSDDLHAAREALGEAPNPPGRDEWHGFNAPGIAQVAVGREIQARALEERKAELKAELKNATAKQLRDELAARKAPAPASLTKGQLVQRLVDEIVTPTPPPRKTPIEPGSPIYQA